jgi:hypothetical protein
MALDETLRQARRLAKKQRNTPRPCAVLPVS